MKHFTRVSYRIALFKTPARLSLPRSFSESARLPSPCVNDIMAKEKDGKAKGQQLKVPKGTKDWGPEDMAIRDKIFETIKTVFKRRGGQTIDT